MQKQISDFFSNTQQFLAQPNAFRSVIILIVAMLLAYWLSRFLADGIVWLGHIVGSRGDNETDDQRNLRYRQVETYLSIAVAVVRVVVTVVVGYVAWTMLSPFHNDNQTAANSIAAIGAGTVFILFAGQTIGVLLRDLTAGAIMITEGWFHVGDYVKLDPYMEVSGVVERFTLRSTRLRALNGEIIWVHNQNITGAHIVPRGVFTMSVEIFVNNKDRGVEEIQDLIDAMPKGKIMLSHPLEITTVEEWADETWHITVTGQTPPQREWLVEDYFLSMVKSLDVDKEDNEKLLTLPPLVHMSDSTADKRFRRAVRVRQNHPSA